MSRYYTVEKETGRVIHGFDTIARAEEAIGFYAIENNMDDYESYLAFYDIINDDWESVLDPKGLTVYVAVVDGEDVFGSHFYDEAYRTAEAYRNDHPAGAVQLAKCRDLDSTLEIYETL